MKEMKEILKQIYFMLFVRDYCSKCCLFCKYYNVCADEKHYK